jgi:hypothetical protein
METAIHSLIPIVMFTGLFSMIFGIRYLDNKEKMAMIQRGMVLPPKPKSSLFKTLRFGLVIIGGALGFLKAMFIKHTFMEGISEEEGQGLYLCLVALGAGIGLLLAYYWERKHPSDIEPNNGEV